MHRHKLKELFKPTLLKIILTLLISAIILFFLWPKCGTIVSSCIPLNTRTDVHGTPLDTYNATKVMFSCSQVCGVSSYAAALSLVLLTKVIPTLIVAYLLSSLLFFFVLDKKIDNLKKNKKDKTEKHENKEIHKHKEESQEKREREDKKEE